jgi:hypothetical protein
MLFQRSALLLDFTKYKGASSVAKKLDPAFPYKLLNSMNEKLLPAYQN